MFWQNEGANRSLFDQLEDFRVDPRPPENSEVGLANLIFLPLLLFGINYSFIRLFQDVEDLMDWWNTVECKL